MSIIKKYINVIEHILALLDTMEEGFQQALGNLSELRYEEAQILFQDIIEAVISIDDAIAPMQSELPDNNIESLAAALKSEISSLLSNNSQGIEKALESKLTQVVVPAFINWKLEIEKLLRPYVAS
jgi:uncharacterized protein YicC (UPF0701 family)